MNQGKSELLWRNLRPWVSRGAPEEAVTGSWCSREMSPSHQLLIEGCWPDLAKSVTRFSKSRFFPPPLSLQPEEPCLLRVSLFGHGHLECVFVTHRNTKHVPCCFRKWAGLEYSIWYCSEVSFVCVCTYMHVSECVHIDTCVCVCICEFLSVHVCTHVEVRGRCQCPSLSCPSVLTPSPPTPFPPKAESLTECEARCLGCMTVLAGFVST